jgi:hypothetical protein
MSSWHYPPEQGEKPDVPCSLRDMKALRMTFTDDLRQRYGFGSNEACGIVYDKYEPNVSAGIQT